MVAGRVGRKFEGCPFTDGELLFEITSVDASYLPVAENLLMKMIERWETLTSLERTESNLLRLPYREDSFKLRKPELRKNHHSSNRAFGAIAKCKFDFRNSFL